MQGYETADGACYVLLKKNADYNRAHQTESEEILWDILKGKCFGFRFRRQHIIKDYIVDFVCLKCRLIIEVDGGYHNTFIQQQEDKTRTEVLNKLGFEVLRFTNEQIIGDTDNVLIEIQNKLQEQIANGKSIIK